MIDERWHRLDPPLRIDMRNARFLPGFEPNGVMQRTIEGHLFALNYITRDEVALERAQHEPPPPSHWADIRRSRSGPFTLRK